MAKSNSSASRVCVIGAGPAGLAMARALRDLSVERFGEPMLAWE